MKKNHNENFRAILEILKDLNNTYPQQGIAKHLHEATLEYKNLWGLEDTELLLSLTKYRSELALNITSDAEIEEILQDGMHLDQDRGIEDYLVDDNDWDNQG